MPTDTELLDLLPDDLPEPGAGGTAVLRLSERHRTLARLLANGARTGEAAAVMGMTPAWVSTMKKDPAFKELVETYRRGLEQVEHGLREKMAMAGNEAVDQLLERLEDPGNGLSVSQLLEIAKFTADRTGHGPSSSVDHNVNVGLAARMDAARLRVVGGTEIEGQAEDVALIPAKTVEEKEELASLPTFAEAT